jgi:phage anti-repressor protein
MSIDIIKLGDNKVVDSYRLYCIIGLHKSVYSRWIKNVKARGGRDIDWFIDRDLLLQNKRIKARFYFTLDFARGLCMQYKTKESNKLIVFLKEQMK